MLLGRPPGAPEQPENVLRAGLLQDHQLVLVSGGTRLQTVAAAAAPPAPPRKPTRLFVVSTQRFPARAEGGFRVVAARVRQPRPAGDQRASDQRLALSTLPVPGHHVAVALQPDAGVPRRPHGAHPHAHRQGHAEPGQFRQVSGWKASRLER